MAAKKRGGHQRPIKGFRPGKEPVHLKKKRAKAELGADASWAQKKAVDAVAGRTPQEVQTTVGRWSLGLFAGGVLLAVAGIFLYGWSVAAGVVVHAVAAGLLFLGYRVRKSAQGLVDLAGSL